MAHRPQIGIAAVSDVSVALCADAVRRAGGEAQSLSPGRSESAQGTLRPLDALLVCGEGDPSSAPAGAWASELVRAALDRDVALLAIGAGMQALNLASGGSVAEVSDHAPMGDGGDEASSYHRIYIAPGSKLAAVVGSGGFVRVNSRHRLGISEPQKSNRLMASAYSLEDGVIEALESPEHDWVIGLQFHPERRLEIPPHFDRLFNSLVERARARQSNES